MVYAGSKPDGSLSVRTWQSYAFMVFLYRSNFPVEEHGTVYLGNGCRCQGGLLEFGEKFFDLFAQLLFHETNGFW
jgi:hypothetical protein